MKENVKRAIQYKKAQSNSYKNMIFTTIKDLGPCFPKEIKQHIDICGRKEAKDQYHKGLITKDETEKVAKEHTIPRETIQRKLKEMMNEKFIIKNNNGQYSISEFALSDLRSFNPSSGQEFGKLLLNNLLKLHYPTINDFKTNLMKLVNIFGFYLLYSLIEACKPIKIKNDDKYMENRSKDSLTERWFEQVINPTELLDSFIATITNQYTDKEREKFIKNHFNKINEKSGHINYLDNPSNPITDPMSASDFCFRRFLYLTSDQAYINFRTTSSPSYELNRKLFVQINTMLKEIYPNYYEMSEITRRDFLNSPKEDSLEDRKNQF